ncbi:hypothetical protein [Ensifer sp. SL37]|uniref:hypothetical protein n=1 Tax=Ensifer sp. SL37 TaxID=2995137 RepID=UPI0022738F2A|nr:hypothetical protein [Ensifer sp. SL37]MCY1745273.1 hypothetical protein [Ensifer sp. SL37]
MRVPAGHAPYFEATAPRIISSLNRYGIEVAVAEAKGDDFAGGFSRKKKAEAAAHAENAAMGTGGLPQPVRVATISPDADAYGAVFINPIEEPFQSLVDRQGQDRQNYGPEHSGVVWNEGPRRRAMVSLTS